MRMPITVRLGCLAAVPVGAAFAATATPDRSWAPEVGETVIFDDGCSAREWVVTRRLRGSAEPFYVLRREGESAWASPYNIRPAGWGFGF